MKVCILTLGCRVNQYDSQVLRELARQNLHAVTDDIHECDVAVLNSCTVTAAADADARRLVRKIRRLNPQAKLAVVGCLPAGLGPSDPDLVLSNQEKFSLFERLNAGKGEVKTDPHWPVALSSFEGHRRPILKVQDGCRFSCSFCVVPRLRGGVASRPLPSILEEARRLALSGAREVVLAGIQLSSYGLDLGKKTIDPRLAPVVEGLLKVTGIRRVRLSSYSSADLEPALLPLFQDGRLCPHLHLPLQSGDEGVLRAMRRPYSLKAFARVVERVRKLVPGIGLTTDIIAGFPGETKKAFLNTLRRIREFGFRDLHPFPYSERPGTAAVDLKPKVDPAAIRDRMQRLLALKDHLRRKTAKDLSGSRVRVVAEKHSPAWHGGMTPEGVRIVFPGEGISLGQEISVKVTGFRKGQIEAARVE